MSILKKIKETEEKSTRKEKNITTIENIIKNKTQLKIEKVYEKPHY
jgi:hypothetical protein